MFARIARTLIICLCLSQISVTAIASHVVGGNLEMVALDKTPGRYRMAVNLYFDDINQDVGGAPDGQLLLRVYRKVDSKLIVSFYADYVSKQPIVYTNQTCATQSRIKTTAYRYEHIVDWNPTNYVDPGGYYVIWQNCCRNGNITNIVQPAQTGQTFYLEFPPLFRDGKPYLNSSPVFDQVDGEYLCVNEPFTFAFDALDADGDQLRYSLQTPFNQFDPSITPVSGSTSGLYVGWLPGFSVANAIPGTPSLTINQQTGELYVKPTKLGLYVFTVVVDEYRNGQLRGSVRRDYQLFVVDCPPATPPDPSVTYAGGPATTIQVCEGKPVVLQATKNPNWTYQWLKDGKNIAGATTPELTLTTSGNYQLITALKANCSRSRRSSTVDVTITKSAFKLTTTGPPRLCGLNGQVEINALSGANYVFQWFLDNGPLTNSTGTLIATKPGKYRVVVRDRVQGCTSSSDTLSVRLVDLPIVSITSLRNTTAICPNDSLSLSVKNQSNYAYQWQVEGVTMPEATRSSLSARQSGQYTVTVTDTTGCQVTTTPFTLTVVTPVSVTLDSVARQCLINGSGSLTLRGNPVGGMFAGPGVSGNQFDPRQAGVGRHELTYTIQSELTCQQGTARRTIAVSNPSVAIVPARPVNEICADDSLKLTGQAANGLGSFSYAWSNDGQALLGGSSIMTRKAGRYFLVVTDEVGCSTQSNSFSLTIAPTIRVRLDSIAPVCGINQPIAKLKGYPSGGIFSGPGVTGDQYDPRRAGVGNHQISYTVNSPFACQNGTATREGIVRPVPNVDLGSDREIYRGSTTILTSGLNTDYVHRWSPPAGLSDPTTVAPVAEPNQTTRYTLWVEDDYGCTTTDSIEIRVYERIWIPDAFSPNNDGVNDSWELRGIETYPDAEVTIYNRWGTVIFYSNGYSKPFDGIYENERIPAGVYPYVIKPSATQQHLTGQLTVIH